MAIQTKERTIAFYEVCELKKAKAVRVTQMDWPALLRAMSESDLAARTWDGDHQFIGTVLDWPGLFGDLDVEQHLLLHRVKDPGEWLSRLDKQTGTVEELESGQIQGFLETSAISFLPVGNILGIVQGSTSSPSHVSLQNWLNGVKAFGDTRIVVRPVVAQAEIERLGAADGASRVEIRIGQSKSAALKGASGRLAKVLRTLRKDYGEAVRVTMVISVPRGRGYSQEREDLLEDLRAIETVMPGAAELAKAKLTYATDQGAEGARMVEFIEHHITAKAKIPAVNDRGETIRVMSAVHAILAQATIHADELLLAVDIAD